MTKVDRDTLKLIDLSKVTSEGGNESKCGVVGAVGGDRWCLGFYSCSHSHQRRRRRCA